MDMFGLEQHSAIVTRQSPCSLHFHQWLKQKKVKVSSKDINTPDSHRAASQIEVHATKIRQ